MQGSDARRGARASARLPAHAAMGTAARGEMGARCGGPRAHVTRAAARAGVAPVEHPSVWRPEQREACVHYRDGCSIPPIAGVMVCTLERRWRSLMRAWVRA